MDEILAMLKSMAAERDAQYEVLLGEITKLQQQLQFLEAKILSQGIAHRTTDRPIKKRSH
jgi:hypothetical protein